MKDDQLLQQKADLIRKWCLIATTEAGSGHPTSCMSAAELTAVLFDRYFRYDLSDPLNPDNDRFILSKGHAAPLLYTLFGMAGAFPLSELKTLRKNGSRFEGHPTPRFAYADAATGSLGQGLSVGAGMAWLAKREKRDFKAFVLLGDGELAEGQVWEAANFASYYRLDNLVAILDINRLAQSGETMFAHQIEAYAGRFRAFGFEVLVIDGHDLEAVNHAFKTASRNESGKPVAIVARTIKGKGVSFIEDKLEWHGKALKKDDLEKALAELGQPDDNLRFDWKKPEKTQHPRHADSGHDLPGQETDPEKTYATREVFGQVLTQIGQQNELVYALDGDVKNSTFTINFKDAFPDRFVEGFIAEQNMVSVAAGLARLGKIPFVATFGAFLTRAADQIRMARVAQANIKFVGSHVGVSIGEDGPSQMALEDIALFAAQPGTLVLQPADAVSTEKLTSLMVAHNGFAYMRTLRPKTPVLYTPDEEFTIGGAKVLRSSEQDELTIAATGITVFEALKAYDELKKQGIAVCVVDGYSISPVAKDTLVHCVSSTSLPVLLTVEDHYIHGGFGDLVRSALADYPARVEKMGVEKIAHSGSMAETMHDAGINAESIVQKVKSLRV